MAVVTAAAATVAVEEGVMAAVRVLAATVVVEAGMGVEVGTCGRIGSGVAPAVAASSVVESPPCASLRLLAFSGGAILRLPAPACL